MKTKWIYKTPDGTIGLEHEEGDAFSLCETDTNAGRLDWIVLDRRIARLVAKRILKCLEEKR